MSLVFFSKYTAIFFILHRMDLRSTVSYFNDVMWRQTTKRQIFTLFKVNSFWLHTHSMPWTFLKKYLHTLICQIRRSIRSEILCLCRFDIGEKKRAIKIERRKIRAKWWLIGNISHFIFNPLMLLINICPRHLLGHLRTFCFTLEIFLLAYTVQWRPSDFHCC